ncbi:MAG: hypothetical protein ABJN69_13015 [Hellea sp.]
MTLNLTELVRRVAFKAGYAGADYEATGNTARIICGAVLDAHAELTARGKATWDIDQTPRDYAQSFIRYMANEANSYLDRSRSAAEYQSEKNLAWRDICAVVTIAEPAPTAEQQERQDALNAIRHI